MHFFNTFLQISPEPCKISVPVWGMTQSYLQKLLQERVLQWYSMVQVRCGSDFGERRAIP